jgi:hypothetical protein
MNVSTRSLLIEQGGRTVAISGVARAEARPASLNAPGGQVDDWALGTLC